MDPRAAPALLHRIPGCDQRPDGGVPATRSPIGGTANQRATLKSLGLRKIGQSVEIEDRPELRGMVNTVIHLVSVEEVK